MPVKTLNTTVNENPRSPLYQDYQLPTGVVTIAIIIQYECIKIKQATIPSITMSESKNPHNIPV